MSWSKEVGTLPFYTPCLQVFTACANAFAHGSNEVANSVGPLAAIYQIWRDTEVSSSAKVPTWLLAVGGFAIVLGALPQSFLALP
jgi:phosphate/sulfate permease